MNDEQDQINPEEEQEEPQNLPANVARMIEGLIADLKQRFTLGKHGWRGATREHNPSKLKGKGYTKSRYNFRKAKRRRKIAKQSRRKNRK